MALFYICGVLKSQRFNPSFTGIALVATHRYVGAQGANLFQSFFYWNCLGGPLFFW